VKLIKKSRQKKERKNNMALIKCPDCGKEYSDTALSCPNCGYTGPTCSKCGKKLSDIDIIAQRKLCSDCEDEDRERRLSEFIAHIEQQNVPKCRYCGSTSLQAVKKNWSPLTGFLTNKTEFVCVNCHRKQ
jgi:DNA-directed RNA polymerase subunit RPC12/RpoP